MLNNNIGSIWILEISDSQILSLLFWFFQVFKCIFKNTKNYLNIKDPKDANDSSDDPKTPRVKVDQVEFISLSEFDTVPKYMKVNTLIFILK